MAKKKKPDPIVVAKGLGRSFGRTAVLSDVDLEVGGGEVLGLVGPNGGGKSTLLMLLAGLLRPTTGTVTVCGTAAHALALESAGLVGLVTARPGLYPLLTGRENLHHFGGLFGFGEAAIDDKASRLVGELELTDAMDRRVGQWSTGMQQKLSLVRALLLSPKLLLLDEPTANLDPVVSHTLYQKVRARADGGLACVLVTHDLPAAESVCDRVMIIDRRVLETLSFDSRAAPPAGPLLTAWRKEVERP